MCSKQQMITTNHSKMTYEKETISIPTYVSLCSGYDGIGIGLKRAIPGLRTIAHVEIETYAIANLIAKMEAGLLDACPVFTDLKQFPYEQLRDRVTILSAGFPCQPFGSAGKRRATEDERHLYPYIADGITAMRPRYVLLENVEGIISAKTADGESVLKYVLGDLEERGYSCTWGVFSASEVGAPHQRKRVFILGKLSDTNLTGLEREASERVQGRERRGENGEVCEPSRSGGQDGAELGYTKGTGLTSSVLGQREEQLRRTSTWSSETELGDTSSERSCGGCEDSDRIKSEMLGSGLGKTRWPSRPGQQQYEWEQPRVVSNTECLRLECTGNERSAAEESGQTRKERSEPSQTIEDISSTPSSGAGEREPLEADGQAQPCVGLSANGTAFRVDELRLLGNGVVPDTCELAFKTLIQQL